MEEFETIIRDFVKDILLTYPEYKGHLNKNIEELSDISEIRNYCIKVYPQHFFDILYENATIFEESIFFLPELDFKELWEKDISDNTRTTIWKYLQLILLNIISDIDNTNTFGDTAKLFEAIKSDDLKEKLDECLNDMQEMFKDDESNIKENVIPDIENLHDHLETMLDGKLGRLAKEIAEDISKDLDIDETNIKDPSDLFKKLFSNPNKLMNLVKTVGGKLDNKMKNGEINEKDILSEASELMKQMNSIPGLGNMKDIFSKMTKNKQGMHNFQQKMLQETQRQKMKERLEKNRSFTKPNEHLEKSKRDCEKADKIMHELLQAELIHEENAINSKQTDKKKKKKKKKKNKN